MSDRILPVRGVWFALRLLLRILEQPELAEGAPARLPDMPPWCEAVCETFARARPPAFADALARLRPLTPTATRRGANEHWIESDDAGVFLLCDTLRRLGWSQALREAGQSPRVAQALIAGTAMVLLRPGWTPDHGVDPAAALLAGMVEAVDRLGFARIFEGAPPVVAGVPAADWPGLIEAAADTVAATFARRVRGFREAGREMVARHFLRCPGRILVTDEALRVVLAPTPWSVVLHISGADETLADLDWLPFRTVFFVLEGL